MQECDVGELLPGPLIRKYIAYAREYVKPVLSDAAKERLQAFYMQLREQVAPGTSMPITARQLESLVRLAEARARVDLREEVTAQDAEDVIEIMREGLFDIFGGLSAAADNALGTVSVSDLRAATNASGARAGSKRAQVKNMGVFIEQLNDAGELLKKGPGLYRVAGIQLGAGAAAGGAGLTQGGTQAGGLGTFP
ncbi:MCM domain-containing protein, partial [Haematococcus lacustris]